MASLLRSIVAGPRAQHPEAGIDLCYVTDNIIATSGPGATYPQVAYRTPVKDLVKFLDSKHGEKWAIWEFRAEGTGYPDSEVYGRVRHYPWPDHHPPPFALIPLIMASMRNWLKAKEVEGRVVVVHCKAGKGRSGTISCSYLISEEGWTPEDAMQRFTDRRMRPGFGVGISIPSQRRWITYVDRWSKSGKVYMDRPVEILELHVWGLRNGVKIVAEGYVEEGKVIKKFHTFQKSEREIVRGTISKESGLSDVALEMMGRKNTNKSDDGSKEPSKLGATRTGTGTSEDLSENGGDVVFRPSQRVVLPSSDINIDFERRNRTNLGGLTMVTSVAHVWFNTYFEGNGPERNGNPDDSGVFEIDFDAMDGIKGSSRKGTRAFDRFAVVWKSVDVGRRSSVVINEPAPGEEVEDTEAADWTGQQQKEPIGLLQKKLGARKEMADSPSVSRASSLRSEQDGVTNDSAEELAGVRSDVGDSGEGIKAVNPGSTVQPGLSSIKSAPAGDRDDSDVTPSMDIDGFDGMAEGAQHHATSALPGGRREEDMKDAHQHILGHMKVEKDERSS